MPGVCPMTSICANCLHGLADRVEALRVALERIVDEKVDDSRDPWAIVAMFRVISRNALRRNRAALRGEEASDAAQAEYENYKEHGPTNTDLL